MAKRITLEFGIDDEDFEDFLAAHCITKHDFTDWVNGEICQNHALGFLIGCSVEDE